MKRLALALALSFSASAYALDPAAVEFQTPAQIKWVRNAAGTNETAVLFGDSSKPGPYVMRLRWLPGNMGRPHFHEFDRHFVVVSGTWWMGPGTSYPAEKK